MENSLALKQCPQLETIYQLYFKQESKKFIQLLLENKDKKIEEIASTILKVVKEEKGCFQNEEVELSTKQEISKLNILFGIEGGTYAN